MMNNMPYQAPNFMPYNPNIPQNSGEEIRRELEKINRELERIEKRLEVIERNQSIKSTDYLSSNIENGKGLYML